MCAAETENMFKPSTQQRKSKRKRPHQKPSRKLNDMCISRMYVTKFKAGNIEVKYIFAHSNHTIGPSEDAFLPVPTSTKEEIAIKLSLGISIERIMDGNVNYYNIPYSGKVSLWQGESLANLANQL